MKKDEIFNEYMLQNNPKKQNETWVRLLTNNQNIFNQNESKKMKSLMKTKKKNEENETRSKMWV